MPDSSPIDQDFLTKINEIINKNISKEAFGVSELAQEIGMSRSNLLRKVKKITTISASQFINQYRLKSAMEMLNSGSLTVSEVSYKVGFGSTSYFIKCFGDYYGYPPGEVAKRTVREEDPEVDSASKTHQLAAIMFTDIEGYTALMQHDEAKAIEFRNRHREVFNSLTIKFNGRILQYYGDGTLSTFNSAIDAVRCGIELQMAFLQEPQIPVRIGIHTGDIIYSNEDIIGDGVNIASRIESLAVPGSVFISEKVFDEIKNQSGIETSSMGLFELKNVDKPVEVFAVTKSGLVVPDKHNLPGRLKSDPPFEKEFKRNGKNFWIKWGVVVLGIVLIMYLVSVTDIFNLTQKATSTSDPTITKKSIAVLPFINDSNDSSNIYFINGLMEATLNNLQKIEDLRVISRTSVEKYRSNSKTSPEIARELNVKYIVEGSGQKIGDQILLNIQLIDGQNDKHLWSQQYNRQVDDIFNLQIEVSKSIADEIEVIITPEEEKRIEKLPTEDLLAYDYFLKGLDLIIARNPESLERSIGFFRKAIEQDSEFARAYAASAIAYFYLDEGRAEKQYIEQINQFADRAMLLDSELPQSLIAKALFYVSNKEYELAESYLEKALEYNPNYDLVFVFLVELYVNYLPDTEKYLVYALRGLEIDISAYDSIVTSLNYLHISNAFFQSGFLEEAEQYISKSFEYNPGNIHTERVRAFIVFANTGDLKQTNEILLEAFKKDTTSLELVREIGMIYYFMRDYENSFAYYKPFDDIRKAYNLDIFSGENAKIGLVFSNMGFREDSKKLFNKFKNDAENDPTIYKHLSLAAYYSFHGDKEKAIEHMGQFSNETTYQYVIIPLLKIDPLFDNIADLPEFKEIINRMETVFWKRHEQIKANLSDKGLI